jgi:integrase
MRAPAVPADHRPLRLVTDQPGSADLPSLIASFAERYTTVPTRQRYEREILSLHASAGASHPSQLTAGSITSWADPLPRLANNTIRQRVSTARTFLRWCIRHELVDARVLEDLADSPVSKMRRTYGKVQDKHPARFLNEAEVLALVTACQDGTDLGLRDEVAIRLGLLGLRATEIGTLTFGAFDRSGQMRWTGKGRKPRTASAPTGLLACLARYTALYESRMGRTVSPADPIVCRQTEDAPGGYGQRPIRWGVQATQARRQIQRIVSGRAELAGIGHVAPHDLRRTAAARLHRSTDTSGAHHYDLRDIQIVLGHADPATTMRSYLEPMDTAVIDRASSTLDV